MNQSTAATELASSSVIGSAVSEPGLSVPEPVSVNMQSSTSKKSIEGVTLSFLLGNFLNECKERDFDWSEPKGRKEWILRLKNSSRLDISKVPGCEKDRHFFIPDLFINNESGTVVPTSLFMQLY